MSDTSRQEFGTTVAGVCFPFCAMNASGAWSATTEELRQLAASATGALVLKTATVHPFIHPAYRSLHNPGFDKLIPLVRELAEPSPRPVVASIAGATVDEFANLARAFAEAGAALVEANLAEPYVSATLAPLEEREVLGALLGRLVAAAGSVPVSVRLPDRPGLSYRLLGAAFAEAGVRAVVARNDFTGFEKWLLEAGPACDVIVVGGIRSGYDVARALTKGARAVQVGSALVTEGPAIFARLGRELRTARR